MAKINDLTYTYSTLDPTTIAWTSNGTNTIGGAVYKEPNSWKYSPITKGAVIEQISAIAFLVKDVGFIAGSAARYYCQAPNADSPNDIDIFLYHEEAFPLATHLLYQQGFDPITDSNNAITFSKTGHKAVQIIKPVKGDYTKTYGSVDEVLNRFSFFIERYAVKAQNNQIVYTSKDLVNDAAKKAATLAYVDNPLDVMMRLNKYAQKGYTTNRKDLITILATWDKRPAEWRTKALAQVAAAKTAYDGMGISLDQSIAPPAAESADAPMVYNDYNGNLPPLPITDYSHLPDVWQQPTVKAVTAEKGTEYEYMELTPLAMEFSELGAGVGATGTEFTLEHLKKLQASYKEGKWTSP